MTEWEEFTASYPLFNVQFVGLNPRPKYKWERAPCEHQQSGLSRRNHITLSSVGRMHSFITEKLSRFYKGMREKNNSTRALSFCIVIKNVRKILCSRNSYFLRENFSLFLTILFRCLYGMWILNYRKLEIVRNKFRCRNATFQYR